MKNKIKFLRSQLTSQICELCGFSITVEEDHNYFYKGKPVHRDCYFIELGEVIEQHPIGFVPPRFLK